MNQTHVGGLDGVIEGGAGVLGMTGITACGVYVKSSVLRTLGAPGFKDLDGTWEGMTRWWEENQGREF